jgi:CheY-like chemotaxis protein
MKTKRILLIADDNSDVEAVREALSGLQVPHTLLIARSGSEALSILMGSSSPHMENYTHTGKVQPHLILLNNELPDMTCLEFMSIMRKYYSLQNIKVHLLSDSDNRLDAKIVADLGIAGCISRIKVDGRSRLKPDDIMPALSAGTTFMFSFSIFDELYKLLAKGVNIFGTKAAFTPVAGGIGAKVVACAAGGLLFTGALTIEYNRSDEKEKTVSDQSDVKQAKITGNPAAAQFGSSVTAADNMDANESLAQATPEALPSIKSGSIDQKETFPELTTGASGLPASASRSQKPRKAIQGAKTMSAQEMKQTELSVQHASVRPQRDYVIRAVPEE